MDISTRLLRATLGPKGEGRPMHEGPVFATAFHASGDPEGKAYTYARAHNPTWTSLEAAIALLEHKRAAVRVFASGMAAVGAVFASVLRPGDTVVLQHDAYFGGRQLLAEEFAARGVTVREIAAASLADRAALAGAKLVWLETPSNPRLEVTDVRGAAAAAHAAGALVAVDNTTATPLGQRPLELGADFSVCSDSKAMCGHSDLMLGHVAVKDEALAAGIDRHRNLTGGIAGPMEAWLALRSLATLPLRLERSSANALALARFLTGRKDVAEVRYPGLESDAGHAVARGQMSFFGPVLGFTLPTQRAAERFLGRCSLVTEATSFGGVTTTAERRARWGHDAVAAGMIRMSVGCEAIDDLLADVERSLEWVR